MAVLRPAAALYGLAALGVALALPGLARQWERQARTLDAVGRLADRAAALDHPAVAVARDIEAVVEPVGCVSVLAYAGPAAVDYYNARLAYLLYPRRVGVFARTAGALEGCAVFAVFRDTEANLAAEPFRGEWDDAALGERIAAAERIGGGDAATVYRAR